MTTKLTPEQLFEVWAIMEPGNWELRAVSEGGGLFVRRYWMPEKLTGAKRYEYEPDRYIPPGHVEARLAKVKRDDYMPSGAKSVDISPNRFL